MSYYAKEYPKVDEVVCVTISRIEKDALYCKLIEYEDKEGFLPITGLNRKSHYNPKKYFKENKIYPMTVMRVDENKGIVDLSYNRIKSDDEKKKYVEKFEYFSKIFKFTHEISLLSDLLMDSILPTTMWRVLQKDDIDNSKEIYTSILDNPAAYIEDIITAHPNVAQRALDNIESRITRTYMTVHQEFNLNAICTNAINVLKEILTYPNDEVKLEYVNAPKYRIIVEGKTEDECDLKLERCIDHLNNTISERTGIIFNIGNKTVAKEKEIFIRNLPRDALLS
jgi:translation initiation factor 2 subunit 1